MTFYIFLEFGTLLAISESSFLQKQHFSKRGSGMATRNRASLFGVRPVPVPVTAGRSMAGNGLPHLFDPFHERGIGRVRIRDDRLHGQVAAGLFVGRAHMFCVLARPLPGKPIIPVRDQGRGQAAGQPEQIQTQRIAPLDEQALQWVRGEHVAENMAICRVIGNVQKGTPAQYATCEREADGIVPHFPIKSKA